VPGRRRQRRRQVPVLRHGVQAEGRRALRRSPLTHRPGSGSSVGSDSSLRSTAAAQRAAGGTRSLVIAPQWIGDAVMTEPLLRRLRARGERVTVGALPWVAPVYRAMPQVEAVIEFPFRHGGLQLRERRLLAKQLEGRFDAAYVLPNSLKSALL